MGAAPSFGGAATYNEVSPVQFAVCILKGARRELGSSLWLEAGSDVAKKRQTLPAAIEIDIHSKKSSNRFVFLGLIEQPCRHLSYRAT